MLREGQMGFSGVRANTADRLNGCFSQFNPRVRVIETEEIQAVMRSCQLIISSSERTVARDSLVEKLYRVEQILFCPRAKRNAIDEVCGSQIEVVGNKVTGRWLLDRGFLS